MDFVSGIFVWAALSIAIPIAIALWNRRRHRKESFGAYYLLKKVLESSKRRIQLLEILKLINRIILVLLLVASFAEPLKEVLRFSEAEKGFALILDSSRVMQSGDLIAQQKQILNEVLDQIPSDSQGVILLASDYCAPLTIDGLRQTASPNEWLKYLDSHELGYTNSPLSSAGLSSCLNRIESLFSDREPMRLFISALPSSFDPGLIKELEVRQLSAPSYDSMPDLNILQDANLEKIKIQIQSNEPANLSLIDGSGRVESIGQVEASLELVPQDQTWLWANLMYPQDPWVGTKIAALKSFSSSQVTLWAQKETDAYLSLLAALKTHPYVQVVRQIGGEPIGENLIVYGSYPYSLPDQRNVWFFVGPNAETPFQIRDFKQWSPQERSSDVRKAFEMLVEDGKIFIKRYNLLRLDRLKVLETFEDGAPALLESESSSGRIWVTPFDLEDLTTDVVLEPTFIPYLFRRLDRWLQGVQQAEEGRRIDLVWSPPAKTAPQAEVIELEKWPGIYRVGNGYQVVEPNPLPEDFMSSAQHRGAVEARADKVSIRPILLKAILFSVFVELILCLVSLRFVMSFMLIGFTSLFSTHLSAQDTQISVGVMPQMETSRLEALNQVLRDVSFLSNLDFAPAQSIAPENFWSASLIFHSSDKKFKPFSKPEREVVRDYLERGGLLVFDDVLAVDNSTYYQSVAAEMSKILPGRAFEIIPKDDVIFRSFYLLNEVSGRRLSSAHILGIRLDNRWVAIFSSNDLLGANLRSMNGDFVYSVSPYGIMQRTLAKRLLLNFLMYSVTLNYKDDAIHLPHILQRRVK